MDSIRVSEAPDSGSIPDEATSKMQNPADLQSAGFCFKIQHAQIHSMNGSIR